MNPTIFYNYSTLLHKLDLSMPHRRIRSRVLIAIAVLLLAAGLFLQSNRVLAVPVTIVVATAMDDDVTPPAQCSLRYAIQAVNTDFAAGGTGTSLGNCNIPPGATSYIINFSGNFTIIIDPVADLPALTADNVTINGLTGGIKTTLSGGGTNVNGLTITGGNNIILGIEIQNFTGDGILIDGGAGNIIGSIVDDEENTFLNNAVNGVHVSGGAATGNRIIGNNIMSTGVNGVSIDAAANGNFVGGPLLGESNLIQGHANAGVVINGPAADQNEVRTNVVDAAVGAVGLLISNGAAGNQAFHNAFRGGTAGVHIVGAAGNTIGSIAEPNFIHSQGPVFANGVHITGAASSLNVVQGNRIGGLLINGNGVQIDAGASSNTIRDNVIGMAGSTGYGVAILNASGNTIGPTNIIQNNRDDGINILTSAGTQVLNNIIRNQNFAVGQEGVFVTDSANVRIEGNTINQNSGIGVAIDSSPGVVVETNIVFANGGPGILLFNSSAGTITQNNVRSNGGDGLRINFGDNNFIGNNVFANNGGIGINLVGADQPSGVTLNDAGDGDGGTNDLQNFPEFTASSDRASLNIVGRIDSTGLFDAEFFLNSAIDPSGFGEAEQRIPGGGVLGGVPGGPGGIDVTIPGIGNVVGQYLTATASQIGVGSSTSELSRAARIYLLAASFVPNPAMGNEPFTVTLFSSTQSELPIGAYFWNLGNGQTSTLANPTTTYPIAGTYTVTLTVWNINGNYDSFTGTVIVLPQPTNTPIPIPTDTPIPTSTFTPVPTDTPIPTVTSTFTPIPTATSTFTPVPTDTPIPTSTFTPVPTDTPIPTATSTFTPIPTNTTVPTNTFTPVPTLTPIPSATPTEAIPDLEVIKRPGDDEEIVIIILNNGPGDAENIIVVEELRPGVVYVSSIPGVPLCIELGGTVTCGLGRLAAGDSTSVSFDLISDGVDLGSGKTTVFSNGLAVAQLDQPYLTKLAQPAFAQPGMPITYTLRVINPTNRTASSVRVTDVMPDGISIVSITSSSGTAAFSGQEINFFQGSLSPGERITITVNTVLDEEEDPERTEIVNGACLTSSLNVSPSCAEYGFFKATALPATGESGRNRIVLPLTLLAGLGATLVMLRRRLYAILRDKSTY